MAANESSPVINLADVPLRDNAHGDKFEAKVGSFGRTIGSTGIGVDAACGRAGQAGFPFHNHHVIHELFVILEGDGHLPLRRGELSGEGRRRSARRRPAGRRPPTSSSIPATTALKYLGISHRRRKTEVVEYPDSGKFAVTSRYDWATGKGGIRYVGRKEGSLDYWDGE